MSQAMGPQPCKHMVDILSLYRCAIAIASNACLEVRVPIEHATAVLTTINRQTVQASLLAFRSTDWWCLSSLQTRAVKGILMKQGQGHPASPLSHLHTMPEALLLTAACVWMLNSLHHHPDDGAASRHLMLAAFLVTDAERRNIHPSTLLFQASGTPKDSAGHTNSLVPYAPNGLVFLRFIKVATRIPCMNYGGLDMNDYAYNYFFGDCYEDVRLKYTRLTLVPALGSGVNGRCAVTQCKTVSADSSQNVAGHNCQGQMRVAQMTHRYQPIQTPPKVVILELKLKLCSSTLQAKG
ncbi:hypothetical protein K435DRAFT_851203 [Dendrothele bispora CBS 962.96]|uniref:Uncharacterized protein n=1 Tax=Dendrothele bispora (strain CBS 962.96) TaxID=1314807 RepID=A0A4S8MMQ1_DENBC|nr:hypothetical protein K435DRAFT_851203 [Dendrothele bispora CBS 962.96]